MRIRPRDPAEELRKAKYALADAEHDLREMRIHGKRPSAQLKKQAEIEELQEKIERLQDVVG